jgi:endo-1,4-beta-xylanase
MATITVKLLDQTGQPFAESFLKSLYAADLHFEPVRRHSTVMSDGSVELEIPGPGTALHARLVVPEFGNVWVLADNSGEGFTAGDNPIDFVREAARSTLRDVKAILACDPHSPECLGHVAAGEDYLKLAETSNQAADLNLRALSHALWAGELAVVERARHKIRAEGPREAFLFGCNAFRYQGDTPYARRFQEVLNYATLPFYLKGLEAEEGKPDYARIEQILAWCEGSGITVKGHPLWWGHEAGIPPWLEHASWDQARHHCERVVRRSVERYRGRIEKWDVLNEAHDWANGLNLTHEQEVETTRICCETAKSANPNAQIIVNNCLPFGENAADGVVNNGPVYERVWTPLSYLKAVLDAGIVFDVIGIQLYCPARDLLTVNKLLDEFAQFGKPLHITELGVRSVQDERPGIAESEQILRTHAEWHSPWDQRIQADWMEWFYTLAYARPEMGAITWWDFADPAFIATSGFLDEQDLPREMFYRLHAWRQWAEGRKP